MFIACFSFVSLFFRSGLQLKHIDQFHLYFPEESQSWLQTAHQNRFIKCNRSRAKQFYETYGLSMATEDLQFKMNAHRLLKQAKALLDELNIPFWLSSGTCLGYFRQCDYITYSGG